MSELPPARSVLVTGASGLIGRQVITRLAAEPGTIQTIVALDLREVAERDRVSGVEYASGDIRDPALEKTLRIHEVDTVVHLAAVVTPGKDSTRELEHSIDVLGTENVLGCALAAGVRQLIYTSSGAAYGYHADNPRSLTESDPLRGNPEFAYSDHKRLVEEMLGQMLQVEHGLFIVGFFARSFPEKMLWSSLAARISHELPVSVLIVRDRRDTINEVLIGVSGRGFTEECSGWGGRITATFGARSHCCTSARRRL